MGLLDARTVTFYPWPDSQTCSACVHGRMVTPNDPSEDGTYVCLIECHGNTGATCPKFEAEPEVDFDRLAGGMS